MDVAWYARRLAAMGPTEIALRARAAVRIHRWRGQPGVPDEPASSVTTGSPALPDPRWREDVPAVAGQRLLDTADRLLDGESDYFGHTRTDMAEPDWFLDPCSGRRAQASEYAFDTSYRDETVTGDIKRIWEPSRHQHLTVLAAAHALTGEARYAERVCEHLTSWWEANPPLRGVHWVSGIELGVRLLSWVWVRRLLSDWPGVRKLFEDNEQARLQIWHHQRWLAALPSHGSSANNHAIAEAAGRLAAACSFDWFPESRAWRTSAVGALDRHLSDNTFPSGINRELATEYHGFVLELGLVAAIEAEASGVAVPPTTWGVLRRMTDALAAILDETLRAPRQGDGDEGHGLVLDGSGVDRWASLLRTGRTLFGPCAWWPEAGDSDVRTALLTRLAGRPEAGDARPERRPAHFADAGMTILRSRGDERDGEIWCRCDGGPHGFLSIAAHAHADALSVELRRGGVDILADPGTFCYHGRPGWRSYFRSTIGHNTLELNGTDQSRSGGPFLWTGHARSRVLVAHTDPDGVSRWRGEHHGYTRPRQRLTHRRDVELDSPARELRMTDTVLGSGRHQCRLAFHLGPNVTPVLEGNRAALSWMVAGVGYAAVLELPEQLHWTVRRGCSDPPLGWYSPGFGRSQPASTLLGTGTVTAEVDRFVSRIRFEA